VLLGEHIAYMLKKKLQQAPYILCMLPMCSKLECIDTNVISSIVFVLELSAIIFNSVSVSFPGSRTCVQLVLEI
jgi:hypothetical protein